MACCSEKSSSEAVIRLDYTLNGSECHIFYNNCWLEIMLFLYPIKFI